jgi:hypothetical protein
MWALLRDVHVSSYFRNLYLGLSENKCVPIFAPGTKSRTTSSSWYTLPLDKQYLTAQFASTFKALFYDSSVYPSASVPHKPLLVFSNSRLVPKLTPWLPSPSLPPLNPLSSAPPTNTVASSFDPPWRFLSALLPASKHYLLLHS